jgi:hypothetical protein
MAELPGELDLIWVRKRATVRLTGSSSKGGSRLMSHTDGREGPPKPLALAQVESQRLQLLSRQRSEVLHCKKAVCTKDEAQDFVNCATEATDAHHLRLLLPAHPRLLQVLAAQPRLLQVLRARA